VVRRVVVIALIALASAGAVGGLRQIEVMEKLEAMTYDWRMRAALLPAPPDVVVVAVDERSLRELQQWPWPRSWHGRLIHALKAAGAKLIAFDIVLAGPTQSTGDMDVPLAQWGESVSPEDSAFAKAVKQAGNVVLAATYSTDTHRTRGSLEGEMEAPELPYHTFAEAALAVGPANIPRDADNVVRRYWLSLDHQDKPHATLAVEVAARAQGLTGDELIARLRSGAAAGTSSILLRYAPAEQDAGGVPVVSYCDVLKGTVPAGELRDKIVLVGGTAEVLQDLWQTPVLASAQDPGGEQRVRLLPGVVVQATAVGCLLTGTTVTPAGPPLAWTVSLAAALLVGASLLVLRPVLALLAGVVPASLGVLLVGTWALAGPGVWTPVAAPILGAWLTYSGGTIYRQMTEEAARRRMRRAWQKRVSPEVLNLILSQGALGHVAAREIYATVLFSDLRGYTTLSANHPPAEVVSVLNTYLARMTAAITRSGGTIHKFMGDGIMAVFGDPVPQPDHALRAVTGALEMLRELDAMREGASSGLTRELFMRIGIHSGSMLAGDIGSDQMLEYTVIGDTVNTASRLESLGKEYGTKILVSADTYEHVADAVVARYLGTAEVRNRPEPIDVYELIGLKGPQDAGSPKNEPAQPA
jgi:adenylate cyclase